MKSEALSWRNRNSCLDRRRAQIVGDESGSVERQLPVLGQRWKHEIALSRVGGSKLPRAQTVSEYQMKRNETVAAFGLRLAVLALRPAL